MIDLTPLATAYLAHRTTRSPDFTCEVDFYAGVAACLDVLLLHTRRSGRMDIAFTLIGQETLSRVAALEALARANGPTR